MARIVAALCVLALVCGTLAIPTWHKLHGNIGIMCTGLATPTNDILWVAAGTSLLKSVDGGANFAKTNCPLTDVLMVLATASHGNNSAIAGGASGAVYTNDGWNFKKSSGVGLISSTQDAQPVGATGYGVTFSGKICYSEDGGHLYDCAQVTPWEKNPLLPLRYGAWISPKIWYATAGSWPNNGTIISYTGGIAKTTDGGKTWKEQLRENSAFYFNDIDCAPNDEKHCVAAAEGPAGAYILTTTDGGNSWVRSYFASGKASAMTVKWVNGKEVWVGGYIKSGIVGSGTFYHSVDYGASWTLGGKVSLDDIMWIDFAPNGVGYAVGVTEAQTCDLFTYAEP